MSLYTYLQRKKEFWCRLIYRNIIKYFFKKYGKGVRLDYRVKINHPENIEIGDFISINWGVNLIAPKGIKIGDYSRISSGVKILNSGLNINTFPREHKSESVIIGKNVWIGTNAIILGVTPIKLRKL